MEPLSATDYALVDLKDELSLLAHAKKLEGHTFREVLELGVAPAGVSREYNSRRYKGGMGTLIEERYFGYRANSDARADFPDAGVELKTTCLDVKRDGSPVAGERLVLTMIPFDRPIEDELACSHLWAKVGRILLIYYRRDKSVDAYDQVIEHVALFTPPPADMAVIEQDYREICELVRCGRAQELSEGKTRYLGACTKGATAASSWSKQYYPPHALAKRRAFCFKQPYMSYVLTRYIIGDEVEADCIVKDPAALAHTGFEDYVLSLVSPYVGMSDREICDTLGVAYTGGKAQWSTISYRMLGLSGNRAAEFEKANISVRTVRIEESGHVRESLSLDTFSFEGLLACKDWEQSALFRYFEETRFFFVSFRKSGDSYLLAGARFWSMPTGDIDGPLRACWEQARKTVSEGVRLTKSTNSKGRIVICNNLPKSTENTVAHVRPHTSRAAYLLSDGTSVGNVECDGDRLPDGQWMTKQSFWLNSDYIRKIVNFKEGE